MFNPDVNVTVDECLVPFKGRCPFRQYIPSKPAKYGIKIWAACDAKTSYCWNMQVYTGKPAGAQPERNQGKRVVIVGPLSFQGHIVTCDNFFTSHALGTELLKKKRMLGTVRRNKPELPIALTNSSGRAQFSTLFTFTETHTIVSYCAKKNKNVLLMSTVQEDPTISEREDRKPQMILDYNKTKSGVGSLDKNVATYSCGRKMARWPMALFYNMLDVSAYNAFVLWKEIDPTWKQSAPNCKRRIFLQELGRALVSPYVKSRRYGPQTPSALFLFRQLQKEDEAAAGPSTAGPSTAHPTTAGPSMACPATAGG